MKLVALLAALVAAMPSASAAGRTSAQLRVIVPRAAVRTGPAFSYRELYRADRGEVFPVIDRNGNYWFRVVLPDGRFGWIYGEQVLPFTVDLFGRNGPSGWDRFREAVFAPSPIPSSIISLTFSGGALGGDGMFIFRPAVTLDAHFALEAHIGEAIGSDGSLLVYGLDGDVIIWPLGPFVPFLALGGGGGTSFPKINGVTQASKTNFALDAGGGLAVIFKKRIIVRFDFRNYTLFTSNSTDNRQEYSGGLEVFF
ncbi:MAG TPA: SH3 domain-containing protein [Polyangia bacterium]|nr:SH3 domain-containing protein [Polyangia bacterium]